MHLLAVFSGLQDNALQTLCRRVGGLSFQDAVNYRLRIRPLWSGIRHRRRRSKTFERESNDGVNPRFKAPPEVGTDLDAVTSLAVRPLKYVLWPRSHLDGNR